MSANSIEPRIQAGAALSLVFRPGERPSANDILRLLQMGEGSAGEGLVGEGLTGDWHPTGFTVSHYLQPAAGWLEIFAGGLMLELSGLAPAMPAPLPDMAHWYGFHEKPSMERAEVVSLRPGEHWRMAGNSLPVIRAMAGLAARLTGLAQVQAVVWHPARSVMAPAAFAAAIGGWLPGGAFPALGLTALYRDNDGAIRSEGLAFFIGQELLIEPDPSTTTAQDAKLAARLINQLVGSDAIHQRLEFLGPSGEHISVEPSGNDRVLRVWRQSL